MSVGPKQTFHVITSTFFIAVSIPLQYTSIDNFQFKQFEYIFKNKNLDCEIHLKAFVVVFIRPVLVSSRLVLKGGHRISGDEG